MPGHKRAKKVARLVSVARCDGALTAGLEKQPVSTKLPAKIFKLLAKTFRKGLFQFYAHQERI